MMGSEGETQAAIVDEGVEHAAEHRKISSVMCAAQVCVSVCVPRRVGVGSTMCFFKCFPGLPRS